jgi:hypothetical protein
VKLFHFANPYNVEFAEATRIGTWHLEPGMPGICPECKRPNERRVSPLVIEWEPGSDKIGDFTWPGSNDDIVVSDDVKRFINERFCCTEFGPVEMHQNPKLKRPERITRRTKQRVWLPFEGTSPLWDMRATAECSLDLVRSGFELERVCPQCERPVFRKPHPRDWRLVIDPDTCASADIFKIREVVNFIFCAERVKEAIEASGFTNAGFRLDGEIPTR